MSYTNWENLKKLFDSDEDYAYFIKQDEAVKDKLTSILPFPIKDKSEVNYSYRSTFENVINGFINTLQILDKTIENQTSLEITEIPDRLNYIGTLSNDYNSKYNSYGFLIAVSVKDLITFYEKESAEKLYSASLNPNIAKACKMIYGDEVDDPNSVLQYGWFRGHLEDNHTELYNKNMGQEYDKEELSEEELKGSTNWLTRDLLYSIRYSIDSIVPYTSPEKIRNICYVLIAFSTIRYFEDNKEILYGYEYDINKDFKMEYEIDNTVKDFIESNLSEFSSKYFSQIEAEDKYGGIINSLLYSPSGNADFYIGIEAAILGYLIRSNLEPELLKDLPSNFSYLMRNHNIDFNNLMLIVKDSLIYNAVLTNATYDEVRNLPLDYSYNYLNYKDSNGRYTVYNLCKNKLEDKDRIKKEFANIKFIFEMYSRDEIYKMFTIETIQSLYNEIAKNEAKVLHKDKLYVAICKMLEVIIK